MFIEKGHIAVSPYDVMFVFRVVWVVCCLLLGSGTPRRRCSAVVAGAIIS